MMICKGSTKNGFQRLIIASSRDSKDDFTSGFDLTEKDVELLIKIAQEMQAKFKQNETTSTP